MLDDYSNIELLDEMFEGVYFVDLNRVITFWNKGAEEITGFSAEEVIGKNCYDNILEHVDQSGKQLCITGCPLHQTTQDGIIRKANIFLRHKAGHRVPVSIKTIPLYKDEKIIGSAEFMVITPLLVNIEDEAEKYKSLALKDHLTGLPNRRYTETYLDLKMKEYKTFNIPFGIAFIDVDHFKVVNDTYGHDVGDEVLKMLARTYVNSTRGNDLIGRWGGEEFLAVFTNCQEKVLFSLVNKIRMLVESSRLIVSDTELRVTISIGATMVKPDDTIESMIKRADSLMYKSKEDGRNRCTVE
ncbi:diguanylate cyclase [[Clostridium] fimetarium]|uniref:PAS domain S-box-containing protein/diguanylate cyclase (GGDEF) domain-containing protein n=1 Tax=[Clostridium] fimetarium TaxID=99656 RepID=A0A1I0PLB5_9FIRM|nr:diguanylate cyclase [[Clostridium] fimetarium]SEW15129.1 PAS domain S-box-containing protein/diguanylate cyclase (GGDEF) domain-containing protein [[Clostridium] fimetarium]